MVLLSLGEKPQYPLDKWLGGTQGQSEHCRGKKNLLLLGLKPPKASSLQPVDTEDDECVLYSEIFCVSVYIASNDRMTGELRGLISLWLYKENNKRRD
jgi:hypothetical protein